MDNFAILLLSAIVLIIIYPFIWLYDAVGDIVFWLLMAAVAAGCFYYFREAAKQRKTEFQELIRDTITRRMHPDEMKRINHNLMQKDYRKAELVRFLQIFRDSIDIALKSKKRNVAESRAQSVLEMHAKALDYLDLIDDENRQLIDTTLERFDKSFATEFYLNLADIHLEKAKTLKTARAKERRWNQAREILTEGQANPKADTARIEAAISHIPTSA